jgi:hypothetical protein
MIHDVIEAVDELRRRLQVTDDQIEEPSIRPSPDEQVQSLHGPFVLPTFSDVLELDPFLVATDLSIDEPSSEDLAAVEQTGIDVLAFYVSFHFGPDWGIYVRERGLNVVAWFLQGPFDPLYRLQQAFRCLHRHEYFHFLTDVALTAVEISSHDWLYVPYVRATKRGTPPWNLQEEGMANAYALGGFAGSALIPDIERFMATQPSGYRDHAEFRVRGGGLKQGMPSLIAGAISDVGGMPTLPMPLGPLLFDRAGQVVRVDDVPVYLIRDPAPSPGKTLQMITSIPTLRQTERFSKDLARLPDGIRRKWDKARQILAITARSRSLNFEKLENCDTVFSIRIDRSVRATIRQSTDGKWEALRIGKHDDVYARLPC